MGFGFIEVGTVTPKAQPGNPKPRMFRLPQANALINRLGFNNDGLAAFVANVQRARFRRGGGILGLNIGKNAATPIERAADDYLLCLDGVYPHADYVTVNISSPNTQEPARAAGRRRARRAARCRSAQRRAELAEQHGRQRADVREDRARPRRRRRSTSIAATLRATAIDGVIATNTTLARDAVARPAARRGGRRPVGRAGASRPATASSRSCARRSGRGFPIIGVGGVMSAARCAGQDRAPAPTSCRSTPASSTRARRW